jgi:ATP-binding cassette subfamily B protein
MNACMILIIYFGARLIVQDQFTVGGLVSLTTFAMQILMNLMMLAMVFVMLVISRASVMRILEVLGEEKTIVSPPGGKRCVKDGSIIFEQVTFSYNGQPEQACLKNISFEVKSGQTLGIIGATGSGKTSLVQLIPRLYEVTEGRLKVGGEDVRDYELSSLRREVAIVLQKNTLFKGTVEENLRWGNPEATHKQLRDACVLAQADGFISALSDGYKSRVEQGGSNFSGGQKQRLCLARALLKNPKILILDDATSSVDTKTEQAMIAAWQQALPETTKVIIAQRIQSIIGADLILVLDQGKLEDIGTHASLLKTNQLYQEIYQANLREDDHAS